MKKTIKKDFGFIYFIIILLIPTLVSCFFEFNESVSPIYLAHAKEFAISGSIKSNFYPIGYTAVL